MEDISVIDIIGNTSYWPDNSNEEKHFLLIKGIRSVSSNAGLFILPYTLSDIHDPQAWGGVQEITVESRSWEAIQVYQWAPPITGSQNFPAQRPSVVLFKSNWSEIYQINPDGTEWSKIIPVANSADSSNNQELNITTTMEVSDWDSETHSGNIYEVPLYPLYMTSFQLNENETSYFFMAKATNAAK